jgi:hypothetical protein
MGNVDAYNMEDISRYVNSGDSHAGVHVGDRVSMLTSAGSGVIHALSEMVS